MKSSTSTTKGGHTLYKRRVAFQHLVNE